MQSRRDQIQAYSFVMGRLNSGMLRVDVDGPDQPVSRTSKGIFTGVFVGLLIGAVVAIYGLIVPGGNSSWQKSGALVIDKESGARFLFAGGTLHPVINEASARLIAGSSFSVHSVSSKSLRGAERGIPVGLVGAPDALPTASSLTDAAWSACSVPAPAAGGVGRPPGKDVLRVGLPAAGAALTGTQAVIVAGPEKTEYLLWNGRRLRLGRADGELQALGYGAVVPDAVNAAFIDAIPEGAQLETPAVPGLGKAGPRLADRPSTVGQLFADAGGRHYLLTQEGLLPLTPTLFALLSGAPSVQDKAYEGKTITVRAIGPSDLAQHTAPRAADSPLTKMGALFPRTPPSAVDVKGRQAVCVDVDSEAGTVSSTLRVAGVGGVTAQTLAPGQGAGVVPSCRPAQLVAVGPGSGALVSAAPVGGGAASTLYLVADDGVKYPIPSAAVAGQLGYEAAAAVTRPTTLLGMLPTGPSLNPVSLAQGGIVTPARANSACET